MDWMSLLQQIVELCIIPLLGVLVSFLIQFIRVKEKELTTKVDNELAAKYISMLADTISECVIATNQTYVENLKNQNAFDKDAQTKAFKKTYDAVIAILSDEAKEYLASAYGDLQTYITKKIEAEVNANK